MPEPHRPRPAADALTAPFWDAAARGELVIQRCGGCGIWQHPPGARCHGCGESRRLAWTPVSGDARTVSWITTRQALVAGFEAAVPYVNVVVELVEQPGLFLLSDLPGDDPALAGALRIGAPMHVTFQRIGDAFSLPQFRPPPGDAR